jgi:hypothetical protein
LTYRFAFAGFWSVAAFAEVELPSPLNDWGVVKGLLLRHFRWWSSKHDIFNVDGCLNIGFAYQNYYMCEDYNSPQSVYWALKSFLALTLPEDHHFWTAEEKPLPRDDSLATSIEPPMHIVCNTGTHHYLLSSGQFCPWPLKATEAKYGKSAYSSHFGFSVPTGPLVQQMAPDSTIAISKDGGDTWRVPWRVSAQQHRGEVVLKRGKEVVESIPTLNSHWKPWKDAGVEIGTVLIAPCSRWPDWYVRFTTVKNQRPTPVTLSLSEGGFAIQGREHRRGELLPNLVENTAIKAMGGLSFAEGTLEAVCGALICSDAGASGIKSVALFSSAAAELSTGDVTSTGQVLKPDANTNLMWQRTLIPTIRSETRVLNPGDGLHLMSAVFAVARTSDKIDQYDALDLQKLWDDVPVVRAGELSSRVGGDDRGYIDIQTSS